MISLTRLVAEVANCTIDSNKASSAANDVYIQVKLTFAITILAGNDSNNGFIGAEGDYWGKGSIGINSNNQSHTNRRLQQVTRTLSSLKRGSVSLPW